MVEGEPTTIEGRAFNQPTEIELKKISSFGELPKWTKPITHGPFLNFKEARQGQMESRYSELTDKKLIEKLSKDERDKYIEYLKGLSELILNTPLDDMKLEFSTDLANLSLERYVKGEKLTLKDLSEEDFVKDTFQTKEQALSRDRKGSRLTSALINPNKINEILDPDTLNRHIDTEWEGDKIIIRFDSLKYMKDLFEENKYDEPFKFETDDKFNLTGQLAIEKDGELLKIPESHLIVTGGEDISIGLVGSYIEGEGLATNTVITRSKNKGKVEIDGKVVQEYDYITVSPPKKDTESTKNNQYKLTVVHTNVNSKLGVTDYNKKETRKKTNEFKNFVYWLEIIDTEGSYDFMKDKEIYAVYSANKRDPIIDFTTAEQMADKLNEMFTGSYVSTKDDKIPYKFKNMDEPIGAIIANSLKPRQQDSGLIANSIFDTTIPLGTIEIVLKSKLYEQIKVLGGKEGKEGKEVEEESEPKNPRLMALIKDYKKYQGMIEAFDKAIKGGGDSPSSYRITNPRMQGPKQEGGKELGRGVEIEDEYADPFTEFSRMVPNATAEDFNDLIDIYEGSESRGYRKGREVYKALLFMADKDIDADALKQAAKEGTDDKVIAAAIEVLEGLAGKDKERPKEFSSSDFLLDFLGIGFGVGRTKIKLEKKTPLIALEAVDYAYRKQINLSGSMDIAGKKTEDGKIPTYNIKGNKTRLQQLIRGVRQFNRRIEALGG